MKSHDDCDGALVLTFLYLVELLVQPMSARNLLGVASIADLVCLILWLN